MPLGHTGTLESFCRYGPLRPIGIHIFRFTRLCIRFICYRDAIVIGLLSIGQLGA